MIEDVIKLRATNFSMLKKPRIGYAMETKIDPIRVGMTTSCAIHYSLHPGMMIRYLKGEYVGKNRNVKQILHDISPYIDDMKEYGRP